WRLYGGLHWVVHQVEGFGTEELAAIAIDSCWEPALRAVKRANRGVAGFLPVDPPDSVRQGPGAGHDPPGRTLLLPRAVQLGPLGDPDGHCPRHAGTAGGLMNTGPGWPA